MSTPPKSPNGAGEAAGRAGDAANRTGEAAMRLLRGTLRANAAFSTLSGLTFLIGGAGLAAWVGRDSSLVPDGVVLLAFAAGLLLITRRPSLNLKAAMLVVALDALYVVDTVIKIAGDTFSVQGDRFFGIAALVVALLATLQAIGIARVRAATAGGAATSASATA